MFEQQIFDTNPIPILIDVCTELCDRLARRSNIEHQSTDFVIDKPSNDFNFKTICIHDSNLLQPFVRLIEMPVGGANNNN